MFHVLIMDKSLVSVSFGKKIKMKNKYLIFVCLILFISSFFCLTAQQPVQKKLAEPVAPLYTPALKPFYHGVASGDPMRDRVIIWTRVTPENALLNLPVQWEVSAKENFSSIIRKGSVTTSPEKDYTVKVDVDGLKPGQYYFYRFSALGKTSITGRTKTLNTNSPDSIKLAVVSCSNWEFGYFNAYGRIAEKEVDAVLHLGDYIYEYGVGTYGDKSVDRKHLPTHEAVTLQDYRTRYSQYHLDQNLRHVRQRHPFITIWDDHEIANNAYISGAQNHQPEKEGDYASRKAAATQAYYEWVPIREKNAKHYRAFKFGSLADVIMLDERLAGRTKQADSIADPLLTDEHQSMLGAEQLAWLEEQLEKSQATWKIIGNQVLFSYVDQSTVHPKNPKNLDSWDGYPLEQKRLGDFIRDHKFKNIIFLAGDTHASWAFEVALEPGKTNGQGLLSPLAIELGTTSVSSGNWNESTPDDIVKKGEAQLMATNPHLKYTNHRDHGYLLLTLYRDKAKAEWYFVETLKELNEKEHLGQRFEIVKDANKLK
jgi:alkaline phosphatase D